MVQAPDTDSSTFKSMNEDAVRLKWIGLAIVVCSAILSNFGVNIQKRSHDKEELLPLESQRAYYTRPLWILGMLMIFLASFGDFEALGFAPQALVASVGGGCTVLVNVLFAHMCLGQSLSRSDIIGTLFIICGIVLSTLANEPDAKLSLADLERQFYEPEFVIYLCIIVSALLAILDQIRRAGGFRDGNQDAVRYYQRLPYLYAAAAGIFGSFSVLLAKCASELFMLTFQGENQFCYFTTYLFVGGMISSLILQTDLLNRAIMVGDTLSVFPVFQCFWIGCSVISGIVYYKKFSDLTLYEWIFLPLALVLIIAGIYLLSNHKSRGETHQKSQAGTVESQTVGRYNYGTLLPVSPAGNHQTVERRSNLGLFS